MFTMLLLFQQQHIWRWLCKGKYGIVLLLHSGNLWLFPQSAAKSNKLHYILVLFLFHFCFPLDKKLITIFAYLFAVF